MIILIIFDHLPFKNDPTIPNTDDESIGFRRLYGFDDELVSDSSIRDDWRLAFCSHVAGDELPRS